MSPKAPRRHHAQSFGTTPLKPEDSVFGIVARLAVLSKKTLTSTSSFYKQGKLSGLESLESISPYTFCT